IAASLVLYSRSVSSIFLLSRFPSAFFYLLFFFTDTATTDIYTLSLHDALPICASAIVGGAAGIAGSASRCAAIRCRSAGEWRRRDRKSTRLNSSHLVISYAVFCLKKKKKTQKNITLRPTK